MIAWAAAASALIAVGPDLVGLVCFVREMAERARERARWPPPAWLWWLAGAVVITVVVPTVGPALFALVCVQHRWRRYRAERAALDALDAQVPELVDLLRIGLSAGSNVEQTIRQIRPWVPDPLHSQLVRLIERVDAGALLADELEHLGKSGRRAQMVTTALASCLRYGMPLDDTLDQIGFEVRADRRRMAETQARKVPVKLLFPLVVCSLPACGLLTIVPLLAGSLGSLPI